MVISKEREEIRTSWNVTKVRNFELTVSRGELNECSFLQSRCEHGLFPRSVADYGQRERINQDLMTTIKSFESIYGRGRPEGGPA